MGPIFYVIAILGCGDAGGACQPVRVADAHYASADACNAAANSALMEQTDLSFPEVIAQCRPVTAPLIAARDKAQRG